jgi:hypothetical protein
MSEDGAARRSCAGCRCSAAASVPAVRGAGRSRRRGTKGQVVAAPCANTKLPLDVRDYLTVLHRLYGYGVQSGHNPPWFKDWRVRGLAAGCLVTGFVVGMVIFGQPWHLPPAWGDIPTWFLAIGAAITAWYAVQAYSKQSREVEAIEQQVRDGQEVARQQSELLRLQSEQLEVQRQQLSDQRLLNERQSEVLQLQADELRESLQERKREAERNIKRDKLMDAQLAEAGARTALERRRQAENIELDFMYSTGRVANNSRRPVTDVTCKVMSNVDRHSLRTANKSGIIVPIEVVDGYVFSDEKDYERVAALRPGASCGFVFGSESMDPDMVLVTWYSDDEKRRWQLDQYGHLVESSEESEYVE